MTKMTPVRVTNLSDVPARICMSLKSKHLSILGSVDPVAIPVGGSHEFTLQLQPTTANPDYRKLIWVSNMLNSHNDVTIQVLCVVTMPNAFLCDLSSGEQQQRRPQPRRPSLDSIHCQRQRAFCRQNYSIQQDASINFLSEYNRCSHSSRSMPRNFRNHNDTCAQTVRLRGID
jgi:hypothetical protein